MKKYCVKCGKQFEAAGREVICPACKAQAAEESKRAAVLKAKRASWNGQSVPVRISGRASTVIREYGTANGLPFAQALDALLRASAFFRSTGGKWEDVTPYKSHRRDKHATEDAQEEPVKPVKAASKATKTSKTSKPQDVPQDVPQEVKQAAKQATKHASKASASKTVKAAKKAAKTVGGITND